MKNKYRIAIIISIIIMVCSILIGSIAYYRVVVKGNIKGSTGNAVFTLKDENGNEWNNKVISLGKINPGDGGSFTVTMDASGSNVDIYATLEIERGSLPTNLKFYTTSDHKSELHKYYSFLETTNQSETLTIYWYWNPNIDDEEDNKFINIDNIEAKITANAVQISEYAMMKNGYSTSSEFWNDKYKQYIRTITFGNDLSGLPSECTENNLCWDISYSTSQNKKVYSYLIDSGLSTSIDNGTTTTEQPLYNLYIVSEATIFAPTNCEDLYNKFTNLKSIDFNDNFNTSKTTNIIRMFQECSSLVTLDLNSFNTSNVTSFSNSTVRGVFYGCSNLTSLYISNFNTKNASSMGAMFYGCSSLTELDLSSFNTSNVTVMHNMFRDCSSLTSLDLSSFNTSKVTDLGYMFISCTSLTSLDLKGFNTSSVTNMEGMFYGCKFTGIDLSNFNTSSVTNMGAMFFGCSNLISLDLNNFNTSNVTNMSDMFLSCGSLTSVNLKSFNTSKVTNTTRMFMDCKKLSTEINIMSANITSYTRMFQNASNVGDAKIIVNYIADASTLVDNLIATKYSNSNVVKGNQI